MVIILRNNLPRLWHSRVKPVDIIFTPVSFSAVFSLGPFLIISIGSSSLNLLNSVFAFSKLYPATAKDLLQMSTASSKYSVLEDFILSLCPTLKNCLHNYWVMAGGEAHIN